MVSDVSDEAESTLAVEVLEDKVDCVLLAVMELCPGIESDVLRLED